MNFEKEFRNVDPGNGYLNDKSCAEIVKYISLSNRMKKITKPLNSNTLNYYSVLFDIRSSAKYPFLTLKVVLNALMRKNFFKSTCEDGLPQFNVMSLEEPEECDAPGIKAAMENSVSKWSLHFNGKVMK